MLKVQAILHDGSVALEFMTNDAVEAEEMRVQCLDFDCVAEVRVQRCIVVIGDKDPEHIAGQVDELTSNGRLCRLELLAHNDKASRAFPIPKFEAELAQRVGSVESSTVYFRSPASWIRGYSLPIAETSPHIWSPDQTHSCKRCMADAGVNFNKIRWAHSRD